MKKNNWGAKDNSFLEGKIKLRQKFLPETPRVLDLYCGNGEIFKNVYKGNCDKYTGIDKEKIHSENICIKQDNRVFVEQNDILEYNVFDLDAYGCPWELFYRIVRKAKKGEIIFYITDGLVTYQKMNGNVNKFVSATEQIPTGFNIPGINRFYIEIFSTMLLDIENRYSSPVIDAKYFYNSKRTVCYWYIKINKK